MTVAVILGAGFSKCADLPTQAEFFDLLLSPELSQSPLQKCITEVIQQFLRDVFGWRPGEPLPSLEDYFTCIDLSANTGHHLGIKYTPKMLRAIRRMTIHRVMQILDRPHRSSPVIAALLKSLSQQEVGYTVPIGTSCSNAACTSKAVRASITASSATTGTVAAKTCR